MEFNSVIKKREKYIKYTPKDLYNIGKYASEYGPSAFVQKFKIKFPK